MRICHAAPLRGSVHGMCGCATGRDAYRGVPYEGKRNGTEPLRECGWRMHNGAGRRRRRPLQGQTKRNRSPDVDAQRSGTPIEASPTRETKRGRFHAGAFMRCVGCTTGRDACRSVPYKGNETGQSPRGSVDVKCTTGRDACRGVPYKGNETGQSPRGSVDVKCTTGRDAYRGVPYKDKRNGGDPLQEHGLKWDGSNGRV